MNISEKIEEIRNQPEYMRVRYVWVCVAVSMFIIFILWIFSIASMFADGKKNSNQATTEVVPSIDEQLQALQTQSKSLKDLNDQSLTIDDKNSAANYPDTNNSQHSAGNVNANSTPQSSMYSNLPSTSASQ